MRVDGSLRGLGPLQQTSKRKNRYDDHYPLALSQGTNASKPSLHTGSARTRSKRKGGKITSPNHSVGILNTNAHAAHLQGFPIRFPSFLLRTKIPMARTLRRSTSEPPQGTFTYPSIPIGPHSTLLCSTLGDVVQANASTAALRSILRTFLLLRGSLHQAFTVLR